ncbi:MAG: CDP-alcohol phosphatidyltransferase family protein [Candidatus Hodarchaeales archaeon]|jgi:phosphatidylglycerophosphate synthase
MYIVIPGVKKTYDGVMRPISDLFHLKLKMLPNHVSVLGFLVGLVSVGLIFLTHWQLGLIIMGISLFLDGVDGNIARVYGLESKTGEQFEIIFDRSLEAMMFFALAYNFGVDYTVVILTVFSILLITSLRDKAKFDPGLKRASLILILVISYEMIISLVFFVHIGAFILQLCILDNKNQSQKVETSEEGPVKDGIIINYNIKDNFGGI